MKSDDVKGSKAIVLQPSTKDFPASFTFTVCSTATSTDGSLPYGDSLATCTYKVYNSDGEDVTSQFITDLAEISGNVATVKVSHPSQNSGDAPEGTYKLTLPFTSALGYEDEIDFKRLIVKDK